MLRAILIAAILGTTACAPRDGVETSLAFMVIIGTMLCKFADPDDTAGRA